MRANEFILKEDILNEGVIDKIKTIYNIITKEPQFIKKVKEVQQNTSLINSIVQSLKAKATDTALSKDDVINVIQSKLPTMEDDATPPKFKVGPWAKEPNNWRRSKLAGVVSLIAVGITSIIRFVGGPAADGNSAVEITGVSTVIILAISLLVVFIDALRNHPKTVGLLSAAGLAALIALVPPAENTSQTKQDTSVEQPAVSNKEAVLKDIDTMATLIYSNYKLGWERGQTLSFMKQQGWLNGQRLEMAQNIANLAYSMPKGYWTTDEFRAIVRKEIAPSIPDNLQ